MYEDELEDEYYSENYDENYDDCYGRYDDCSYDDYESDLRDAFEDDPEAMWGILD